MTMRPYATVCEFMHLILSTLIFSYLIISVYRGNGELVIDTEKLLNNLDIKQVIETYTGRRIHGSRTMCPFHNDKNPSLSLKTDKGTWHCFACGTGGNAINFTREFYGLSFIDAVKKLSTDFNVNDIGLIDTSQNRDRWDDVEIKCRKQQQQELQQIREDINSKIDTLTAVHRCLYHLGYEEAAEQYAVLLDNLQTADLYTAYKLLFGR